MRRLSAAGVSRLRRQPAELRPGATQTPLLARRGDGRGRDRRGGHRRGSARGGGSKLIRASKRVQLTNEPTPSLVPTSAATPRNPLSVLSLFSSIPFRRPTVAADRWAHRRRREERLVVRPSVRPSFAGYSSRIRISSLFLSPVTSATSDWIRFRVRRVTYE